MIGRHLVQAHTRESWAGPANPLAHYVMPSSLSKPSKYPINSSRKYTPNTSDGRPAFQGQCWRLTTFFVRNLDFRHRLLAYSLEPGYFKLTLLHFDSSAGTDFHRAALNLIHRR